MTQGGCARGSSGSGHTGSHWKDGLESLGSWGRTLRLYDPTVFHKHSLLHTLCEGTAQNLGSKRTLTVGTVPNKAE